MRRRLRLVPPVGLAALAGCSLAVSLDGLSGGGGGPRDAGRDASADAVTQDGSGADAPSGDGGATDAGYCSNFAVAPKFCVDFSRNRTHARAKVDDEFEDTSTNGLGTVPTLNTSLFTSGPAAAAFDILGGASFLYRTYDTTPTSGRFGASIRIEASSLPGSIDLIEVRLASLSHAVYLQVSANGSARVIHAYDPGSGGSRIDESFPLSTQFVPRKWFRVDVSVAGVSTPLLSVTVDGAREVADKPLGGTFSQTGQMQLISGYTSVSGPQPGSVLVDDFVATW